MASETNASDFLQSLMDTSLYSMGAFFCDSHPELIDEVISQSDQIEHDGLKNYSDTHNLKIEEVFQTLITGLAVRYYKAVIGS